MHITYLRKKNQFTQKKSEPKESNEKNAVQCTFWVNCLLNTNRQEKKNICDQILLIVFVSEWLKFYRGRLFMISMHSSTNKCALDFNKTKFQLNRVMVCPSRQVNSMKTIFILKKTDISFIFQYEKNARNTHIFTQTRQHDTKENRNIFDNELKFHAKIFIEFHFCIRKYSPTVGLNAQQRTPWWY